MRVCLPKATRYFQPESTLASSITLGVFSEGSGVWSRQFRAPSSTLYPPRRSRQFQTDPASSPFAAPFYAYQPQRIQRFHFPLLSSPFAAPFHAPSDRRFQKEPSSSSFSSAMTKPELQVRLSYIRISNPPLSRLRRLLPGTGSEGTAMAAISLSPAFMPSLKADCFHNPIFKNVKPSQTVRGMLSSHVKLHVSAFDALLFGNVRYGISDVKLARSRGGAQGHGNSEMVARRGGIRADASDAPTSANKREVVYDPQLRFEELTMELNSSSSAPLSNLTLFSPSKVNVFLRITGKRPDGFHDLASLFHVISLGDIIKFSVSPSTSKDSLTTNAFGVPLDEKNLIIKAFNLYRKKTGTNKFFWVHLDKRVPTGAGLGGGSGNAATALWAANQMNGNIASEKELQAWSGEIGSDCPFFFSQGAAYCTSKGEVVQDIPTPIPLDTPMVLIKPQEECSTVEVYKRFTMDNVSDRNPDDLLKEIVENGISQSVCVNDLEPPAFEVLPTLKALKQRVLAASRGRYQAVFMSGSGSTIVGVGDSEPPQFIYDEDKYRDVFVSEAYFLTRKENEWYQQPVTAEQLAEFEDKTCSIEQRTCE